MSRRDPQLANVPPLKCETIVPLLPRQWLWTYLLIKAMVICMALATMALVAS